MEKRETGYLIIGCGYMGMDILPVLKEFVRVMNVERVIHLGSTLSPINLAKMHRIEALYQEAELKLRVAKNDLIDARNLLQNVTDSVRELLRQKPDMSEHKASVQLDKITKAEKNELQLIKRVRKYQNKVDALSLRLQPLKQEMDKNNKTLLKVFPDAELLPEGHELEIGKHLKLLGVSPAGTNISSNPLSGRALNQFRKQSVIVPHPISCLKSHAKPGTNTAHTHITTGCMTRNKKQPSSAREFHRALHIPSAVWVVEDLQTGEYHAQRILVEQDGSVLVDGLRIAPEGEQEAHVTVCATDEHILYHNEDVMVSLFQFATMIQPDEFLSLGDVGEFEAFSHWTAKNPRKREGVRADEEIEGIQQYLESAAALTKNNQMTVLDSNHQQWLTKYIDTHPELEGLLDPQTLFASERVTWREMEDEREPYMIGDATFRHGHEESGCVHGWKLFGKYRCGHWHWREEWLTSYALPCVSMLNRDYAGSRLTGWMNGFGVETTYEGYSSMSPKIVLYNVPDDDEEEVTTRVMWRGKILEF